MDVRELDGLGREALIERAFGLGVERANVLTRSELLDEIVRRSVSDPGERQRARGLLGLARDLLARVVERGLHLPETAKLIRGAAEPPRWPPPPKPPLATVTLAEIYAAQGYVDRALGVLDEVLAHEPEHAAARALRERIPAAAVPAPVLDPERDEAPSLDDEAPSDPPAEARAEASASAPDVTPARPDVAPENLGAGSVSMPDDVPLVGSYDVDEVVLLAVDPHTLYAYWEARSASVDEVRALAGEGKLVVRVVTATPAWTGPVVVTRDFEAPALVGDVFVRDVAAGAVVRAALGWRTAVAFVPLAIADEARSPVAAPASSPAVEVGRWPRASSGAAPREIAPIERAARAYAESSLAPARDAHATVSFVAGPTAGGPAASGPSFDSRPATSPNPSSPARW